MKTTLTMAGGAPGVPRGTVLRLTQGAGAGKEFVVVGHTMTTLTLVPFRWWHKVPWWAAFLFGGAVGVLLSQVL